MEIEADLKLHQRCPPSLAAAYSRIRRRIDKDKKINIRKCMYFFINGGV
jgi:hypothetical protein